MASRYICARCGLPIGLWDRGSGPFWKHHGGWHSKPSCHKPPIPVLRPPSN